MKEFKYDVTTLIHCVRDRPCLWNKTLESYKDRVERRNAWEEIFNILDDGYEMMSPEEKRFTGEHVLNKWTNLRDTFIKTLKTKMGRPKRRYILYDHLSFLTQIIPKEEGVCYDEPEVSVPFIPEEIPEHIINKKAKTPEIEDPEPRKRAKKHDVTEVAPTPSSSDEHKVRKRSRKKEDTPVEDSNDEDMEYGDSSDPRIMNEDEAFFASLLPTIVRYDEDERLEFRIEVLSVMKRIKDKKKWSEGQHM